MIGEEREGVLDFKINWKSKTKVEGKSKVEIEDFLRFFFTCMHRVLEEARDRQRDIFSTHFDSLEEER